MDRHWTTVGSSNLDPLSLALNLEANLITDDPGFNDALGDHLAALMARDCQEVDAAQVPPVRGLALLRSYLAFHVMRRFPQWARGLPPHAPRLQRAPRVGRDPA